MKYIRQTWSRFLISLFGGGILSELIFISTGNPNRPRHNGDFESFMPLICLIIIYATLTIIVNSRTIQFSEANDKSPEVFPNNTRKKYILAILIFSIISVIDYTSFARNNSVLGNLRTSLGFVFMVLPILSFLLGLIIALFPYKQFDFDKRYKRAYWVGLFSLNIIYVLFTTTMSIIAFAGGFPAKQINNNVNDITVKQKTISDFKSEMTLLCDSSNYYFDFALTELDKGKNTNEISAKITPKIKFFESQLDQTSRAFQKKATDAGLTDQEYQKTFDDLKEVIKPMQYKNEKLRMRGIEIK